MAKKYVMKDGDRIVAASCRYEVVDAKGMEVLALVEKPARLVRADGKEMPLGSFVSESRAAANAKAKPKRAKKGGG